MYPVPYTLPQVLELAEGTISDAICDAVSGSISEGLHDLVNEIHALLHPDEHPSSPQQGEATVIASAAASGVSLLSFVDHPLFSRVLPSLDQMLSAPLPNGHARATTYIEMLTGADGRYAMPFLSTLAPLLTLTSDYVDLELRLTGLQLGGLHTFQTFHLFRALGHHVGGLELAASRLEISAQFELLLTNGSGPDPQVRGKLRVDEPFNVSVGLAGMNMSSVAVLLAIDEGRLNALQLGSLVDNTSSCLLTLLYAANLTQLVGSLSDVLQPILHSFINAGVSQLLTSVSDSLFLIYEDVALEQLPALLDNTIRTALNDWIRTELPAHSASADGCPYLPPTTPLDATNAADLFADYRALSVDRLRAYLSSPNQPAQSGVSAAADEVAMAEAAMAGVSLVNFSSHTLFSMATPLLEALPIADVLDAVTDGTGELTISFGDAPLVHASGGGFNVSLAFSTLRLGGLLTLNSTGLFHLLSAHVFQTQISAQHLDAQMEISLHLGLPYGLEDVYEAFNVTTGVTQLDSLFAALLAIDETKFDSMQVVQGGVGGAGPGGWCRAGCRVVRARTCHTRSHAHVPHLPACPSPHSPFAWCPHHPPPSNAHVPPHAYVSHSPVYPNLVTELPSLLL